MFWSLCWFSSSLVKEVPGLNEFPPQPLTYNRLFYLPTNHSSSASCRVFSANYFLPFTWVRQCSSPSVCTEEICQGQAGINHTAPASVIQSISWKGNMSCHSFCSQLCNMNRGHVPLFYCKHVWRYQIIEIPFSYLLVLIGWLCHTTNEGPNKNGHLFADDILNCIMLKKFL